MATVADEPIGSGRYVLSIGRAEHTSIQMLSMGLKLRGALNRLLCLRLQCHDCLVSRRALSAVQQLLMSCMAVLLRI